MSDRKNIAIVGGGPSALFVFKNLLEAATPDYRVLIFESADTMGEGLPYSKKGAGIEHVTNVSGNEIPEAATSLRDWINSLPKEELDKFRFDAASYTDYKVLPRLLFGKYLAAQFDILKTKADSIGLETVFHNKCIVADVEDASEKNRVVIVTAAGERFEADAAIICTGHRWPRKLEGNVKGYFDSPYPPQKLREIKAHEVAITGSSLTAIDAVRTLARNNGTFTDDSPHHKSFNLNPDCTGFRIILYSTNAMLPSVRFHLDDPHLQKTSLLTDQEIDDNIRANNGFLSLDFIFEKDFKETLKKNDPEFYLKIKDISMEAFVASMLEIHELTDPFDLLKQEYDEAARSIRDHRSIYWKEKLSILSAAMNYPAKHFSAEDRLRLTRVLMPLISVVIAFLPQSSCEEILALHDAGLLSLEKVDKASEARPSPDGGVTFHFTDYKEKKHSNYFQTFIDATGQPHLSINEFPFHALVKKDLVSQARMKFRSKAQALEEIKNGNKDVVELNDEYFLNVPGIAIDDSFRIVGANGVANDKIFMMAVPYIGGFNPDYSGLDFCERTGKIIVDAYFKKNVSEEPA